VRVIGANGQDRRGMAAFLEEIAPA